MKTRSRAFTLIELLVVIAIIAILAAILFPVFAQAKEAAKKSGSVSNIKQTATAMVMYSNDNDDLMPLGVSPRGADGTWRWDAYNPIPADWPGGFYATPVGTAEYGMVWANSSEPYRKNYEILVAPGTPDLRVAGAPYGAAGTKKWASASYAYNGLLQSLSTSAVSQPSRLAMLSIGSGKAKTEGFVDTLPVLRCNGTGPCLFRDGAPPQANATGTVGSAWFWNDTSAWVYAGGMHFAAVDTSAKFQKLSGKAAAGTVLNENEPFSGYDAKGSPLGMWVCRTTGQTVSYSCFFRPDNEFDNY